MTRLTGAMSTALTRIAMRRPWCVVHTTTARALIEKGYVVQKTLAIRPRKGIAVELTAAGQAWADERS